MKRLSVVLDTETSGLNRKIHEILSLTILPYEPLTFKPYLEHGLTIRIKATKPCDPRALEINGLDPTVGGTNEEAIRMIEHKYQGVKFEALCQNSYFDRSFLEEQFGIDWVNKYFHYHWNDTMILAKSLSRSKSKSLQNLIKFHNIEGGEPHTSFGDCISTLRLMKFFSGTIQEVRKLQGEPDVLAKLL